MSNQQKQSEIERLCREWQARLRLQDWHIAVELVDQDVMADADGDVMQWYQTKEAVIRLSRMIAVPISAISKHFPCSAEETLVHELLEIHFAQFKPEKKDKLRYDAAELAINLIAQALVTAVRGNGHTVEAVLQESEMESYERTTDQSTVCTVA